MKKLEFGILVSGGLGAICLTLLLKDKIINFVFTDKHSDKVISICNENKIPYYVGNPRNKSAYDFLEGHYADIILSINFLYIIDEFIFTFPKLYAINFHGSLLPKYRGRTPHVWAIINNEKVTGITAHIISAGCDEGDIIYQEKFPIPEDATGGDILQEFIVRYPQGIAKVIEMVKKNQLKIRKQDEKCATYFGKRTSADGHINWNWQKERIKNWVRAQAKPYPGAFSFYETNKVIIHRIEFSDFGYSNDDINGTILEASENIIVKTPNGAIKLIDIEVENKNVKFIKGKRFDKGY